MTERPDPLDSALQSAWNNSEPEGPECHLCGNQKGPWLPDPSGNRWPSGAQKLICSRGCPEPTSDDNAGKDSRGGTQPPAAESTLTSDVLALLAAIREALEVPYAKSGSSKEDRRKRRDTLDARVVDVRSALTGILNVPACGVVDATAQLRLWIADSPINYPAYISQWGDE